MLNDSRMRKSPKEIVSDYAIVYGIKSFDPFFCIYSVQSLDFDSMKSTMSIVTNPKDESEYIPKNVLEEVIKISFKAFYSYHTKTQCFDWFTDDYCFTHYPAHLEHGGTAQVEVFFESIRKGVFLSKGKISSITDSTSSTYTQTLVVGEGRIHMLKLNPPTGIIENENVSVMDIEREDSEETNPSPDDRQEIGEQNDRTIGNDFDDVPLQSSENEIGESLRKTPRESPPEEDALVDISMRSESSESSDWNNPENPFLDDDNNSVRVRNTEHSEKSSS
ncbi:hypothetical protein GCK72_014740 [Caenorhabditis remanei]|uniref:Uncharacterized protein n=1 Tax=Caenorhabditis remanei TaxID=31234 RepID=A0A6A5GV94_CAERE|nr:hypothetical protein GCK72_014740 [Caenorhabditis remanei]KAF1758282.1 hypothetical protein GCK72_014740 [Caenorhabditis remanei]